MCQDEYSKRAKNQKKYHMGLVTRVGLEKSLENVPKKDFEKHYAVPPEEPNSILSWNVALKHDSCFIGKKHAFRKCDHFALYNFTKFLLYQIIEKNNLLLNQYTF